MSKDDSHGWAYDLLLEIRKTLESSDLTKLITNLNISTNDDVKKLLASKNFTTEKVEGHEIIPADTHVITNWSSSKYQYFTQGFFLS